MIGRESLDAGSEWAVNIIRSSAVFGAGGAPGVWLDAESENLWGLST